MSIVLPTYPTTDAVLTSLQTQVEALQSLLTNFNAGGATETLLEAEALNLGSDATTYPGVTQEGAYQLLEAVQAAAYILSANGSDLDNKAADVGVYRKAAVAATGVVVFSIAVTSGSPTVIPIGTIVGAEPADPTASPILYATTQTATIIAGQLTSNAVDVVAVATGTQGNVIAGAVNQVLSGPGGTSVTNPNSIGGGADTEGDDSPNGGLRARALAAVPNASQCTIAALIEAAESYAGIVSATVLDNTADDGITFERGLSQLYVDDGTGDLGNPTNPNHAVIAELQAALNSGLYRSAGTQVNVVGSILLPVTIGLQYIYDTVYASTLSTPADIQTAVQLAIYNYVNALPIGRPVIVAELITQVCGVGGVWNVPVGSVVINGTSADLYPTATQTARCENLAAIVVTGTGIALP
jgi:uncharacterized phage protein gp47/JayE